MPKTREVPVLYTVEEVAGILKVAKTTVLSLIHERELLAVRCGIRKGYRVLLSDLNAFIERSRRAGPRPTDGPEPMDPRVASALADEIEPRPGRSRVSRHFRRSPRCPQTLD